jgi:NAD(P)H-hydrate epimerase
MKLVTAAQMRAIDRDAIERAGIPGPELMENAGRGIADEILSDHIKEPSTSRTVVFCGKGNNGGDGFVVARCLAQEGVQVSVYCIGTPDELSEDARLNYDRAKELGLTLRQITDINDLPDMLECDIIVDAVFGTGFAGAPRGIAEALIEYINRQNVETIAVDMPSGLNADTGEHDGGVVEADSTYTLALPKYGLFLSPGREVSGTVETIPIGIPEAVVERQGLEVELMTPELIAELLPLRPPDGHKGDFGKVLLVAGSTGLTGAAVMAGQACARSGSGLVKIACPRTVQPVIASHLIEVMSHPLPDVAKKGALAVRSLGEIRALLREHDALVLGPGIGCHRETFDLVRRLLDKLATPAIVDADGLNALAEHLEIIRECAAPMVLTPHPGEFTRLTGETVPDNIHEKIALVRHVATDLGVIIVLKGSPTIVGQPGGPVYLNQTGNEGMASGGSGDVLSGMIGSFLGQGMTAIEAALAGVFIHGLAGDLAAEKLTSRAMIAGDIIRFLPEAFRLLET